jgi:hypothetical protein
MVPATPIPPRANCLAATSASVVCLKEGAVALVLCWANRIPATIIIKSTDVFISGVLGHKTRTPHLGLQSIELAEFHTPPDYEIILHGYHTREFWSIRKESLCECLTPLGQIKDDLVVI